MRPTLTQTQDQGRTRWLTPNTNWRQLVVSFLGVLFSFFLVMGNSFAQTVEALTPLGNPSANIDQAKNGPYTAPLTPMQWVNGNL
ncbi:MAG TPA: hypothetical protein VLL95_03950, partial [Phnomibacter sp.]|nr:hypothetical protein [Phnomibacter sp.]